MYNYRLIFMQFQLKITVSTYSWMLLQLIVISFFKGVVT